MSDNKDGPLAAELITNAMNELAREIAFGARRSKPPLVAQSAFGTDPAPAIC